MTCEAVNMKTRVRFEGLRPITEYKVAFTVKVKRRGLFGIPYTVKEKRVKWVPWKVYKNLERQARGTSEATVIANLFKG